MIRVSEKAMVEYDVEVRTITTEQISFASAESSWAFDVPSGCAPKVGQIGRLTIEAERFSFIPYADQRLRRSPQQDVSRLFCWHIDDRELLVKEHVLPGVDGVAIEDETETIELDVPPELIELCDACGVRPEVLLRGFIADLCGLQNLRDRPREDGYDSNGSDERMLAQDWFDRAHGKPRF